MKTEAGAKWATYEKRTSRPQPVLGASYVQRKIYHHARFGTPMEIGPNGGACPVWKQAVRTEDARRVRRFAERKREAQA